MAKEGLCEKLTFTLRHATKEKRLCKNLGRSILGSNISKCKGPEAGVSSASLRNSEEPYVVGSEQY